MATHYDRLGVKSRATAAEIKSAYRQIALQHHPDRSKNPRSKEIFLAATEAYEVLADADRRKVYDESLEQVARYKAEQERAERVRREQTQANFAQPAAPRRTSADIQRLAGLYAQGRMGEAEKLAREVSEVDPKQPLPYAILGDIAKSKGNVNQAAKMYAYAVQFDPQNVTYQRRYEQLLNSTMTVVGKNDFTSLSGGAESPKALTVAASLSLILLVAVAAFRMSPALPNFSLISTWSVTLFLALFGAGLSLGVALSLGNWLDRFTSVNTNAVGGVSPAVILSLVACVNFWIAALLYGVLGAATRAFNYSTTRLVLATGTLAFFFSLAAAMAGISFSQTLLWGGNVLYLSAIIGWLVSDAFRS